MTDVPWLSVGQLGEVERAFHRDSPVQTLVAEVRVLRGRVAYLERMAEFYRRRGERFRVERNESRERVAALEEDVLLEAEACDNQSAQLLEIAETIGVVPGVAVVPGVKALQDRLATLEDGIRAKAHWWDREHPDALAYVVTDSFRRLLDVETDRE